MSEVIKLVGVVNGFLFLLVLMVLLRKTRGFDIQTRQISELAKSRQMGIVFDLSLLVYALFELIFLFQVMNIMQLWFVFPISLPLFISILAGVLAGMFTLKNARSYHHLFAMISIMGACVGALVLGFYLIPINFWLGALELLLDVPVIFLIGRVFLKMHTLPAKYEFVFFTGLLLWNCLNTIPLYSR